MFVDVKNSLKKRKREKNSKDKRDKNLGSHLKRRRKELDHNQDWVARGICSVSYLSKIENNKTEENQTLVKEIMERLEIDPKIFQINIQDEQYLEDAVKAFYYHDLKTLEKIYHEVKEIEHNLTINIVKFCYMVATLDSRANKMVIMLEQMVTNMSDFDLQAFLVFAGYFYEEKREYLVTYELFDIALDFSQENEYLTAMANKKLFEVNQYLRTKNNSVKYGIEAERLMQKHHNLYRLDKFNLAKISYLLSENPYETEKALDLLQYKDFEDTLLNEYYLLCAKTKVRLNKLQEAKTFLHKIDKDSEYDLDALFLRYQIVEDAEEKESIAKMVDDHTASIKKMPIVIKFRLMREKDIEKQKEYLKAVAIPYAKKVHNLDLFYEFVQNMIEICMNTSRYKEATQYIKSYVKQIEKTNQFIEEISLN